VSFSVPGGGREETGQYRGQSEQDDELSLINLMPGDSARPVMWHKGKDSASDVIVIPAGDYKQSVERLKTRKTILCV